LRVASPTKSREAQSTNVELKASDSSSNPYLALGGVIAAGLDGIDRGLELAPPATMDPHLLSDEERKAIHADRLPQSLQEAITNLRSDRVLMEALGERAGGAYIAVKEADIAAFASEDQDFEARQHAYKF
jgi:glutamine synthetase